MSCVPVLCADLITAGQGLVTVQQWPGSRTEPPLVRQGGEGPAPRKPREQPPPRAQGPDTGARVDKMKGSGQERETGSSAGRARAQQPVSPQCPQATGRDTPPGCGSSWHRAGLLHRPLPE